MRSLCKFCSQKLMHNGINATMSYYFPSPPDKRATIYNITQYVVYKNEYC